MADGRPHIPANLKRALLQEAGYRCAVPTCRSTSALQFEHINDWATVKSHDFENMVVLCANCHARVTSREIHKDAIRAYKDNLGIISGRYTLFEMRIVNGLYKKYLKRRDLKDAREDLWRVDYYHVSGIVEDGIAQIGFIIADPRYSEKDMREKIALHLTEKGVEFMNSYRSGQDLLEQ